MKDVKLGILLTMFCSVANAGLITGDFRTESDLPGYGSSGALVYESLDRNIGQGYELDDLDFVENPSDWNGGVVWVDYDESTNILTLSSQDTTDFQTFDLLISNIVFDIVGEVISGISLISDNLIEEGDEFGPVLLVNPVSYSYTSDSISISYEETGEDIFYFTGGTAKFQIATSVPEPGSLVLLGLGLAGLGFSRRKIKT